MRSKTQTIGSLAFAACAMAVTVGAGVGIGTAQIVHAEYGMAGCGIGALVFGDQEGPIQIVAATLNATSGSQTLGITSGTSACSNSDMSASLDQELFVQHNYAMLLRDAAVGQGEYLSALATVLGCSQSSQSTFAQVAHGHYDAWSVAPSTQGRLLSIKAAARQNTQLRSSCTRL